MPVTVFPGHRISSRQRTYEEKGILAFVAHGELDESDNVPVGASVARYRDSIASEGPFVRVYSGTGHSLMLEGEPNLVSPLIEDLEVWIEKHPMGGGP